MSNITDRDMLKELLKQAQDKYFELCSEYARDSEGKTVESFEDFCADYLLANDATIIKHGEWIKATPCSQEYCNRCGKTVPQRR